MKCHYSLCPEGIMEALKKFRQITDWNIFMNFWSTSYLIAMTILWLRVGTKKLPSLGVSPLRMTFFVPLVWIISRIPSSKLQYWHIQNHIYKWSWKCFFRLSSWKVADRTSFGTDKNFFAGWPYVPKIVRTRFFVSYTVKALRWRPTWLSTVFSTIFFSRWPYVGKIAVKSGPPKIPKMA